MGGEGEHPPEREAGIKLARSNVDVQDRLTPAPHPSTSCVLKVATTGLYSPSSCDANQVFGVRTPSLRVVRLFFPCLAAMACSLLTPDGGYNLSKVRILLVHVCPALARFFVVVGGGGCTIHIFIIFLGGAGCMYDIRLFIFWRGCIINIFMLFFFWGGGYYTYVSLFFGGVVLYTRLCYFY